LRYEIAVSMKRRTGYSCDREKCVSFEFEMLRVCLLRSLLTVNPCLHVHVLDLTSSQHLALSHMKRKMFDGYAA